MIIDFETIKGEKQIINIINYKIKKFENNKIRILEKETNLNKKIFKICIDNLIEKNKIEKLEDDIYKII